MTDKTDALRARELLAAEYTKRGMGVDFVNDAGTPTAIALAAIREALAAPAEGGQPAASAVAAAVAVPRNPSQDWLDKVANLLGIDSAEMDNIHAAILSATPPSRTANRRRLE